jgi:hypothetical protein
MTLTKAHLTRKKIKLLLIGEVRSISEELLGRTPVKPRYSSRDVIDSLMPVFISSIECLFMEIEPQSALQ